MADNLPDRRLGIMAGLCARGVPEKAPCFDMWVPLNRVYVPVGSWRLSRPWGWFRGGARRPVMVDGPLWRCRAVGSTFVRRARFEMVVFEFGCVENIYWREMSWVARKSLIEFRSKIDNPGNRRNSELSLKKRYFGRKNLKFWHIYVVNLFCLVFVWDLKLFYYYYFTCFGFENLVEKFIFCHGFRKKFWINIKFVENWNKLSTWNTNFRFVFLEEISNINNFTRRCFTTNQPKYIIAYLNKFIFAFINFIYDFFHELRPPSMNFLNNFHNFFITSNVYN